MIDSVVSFLARSIFSYSCRIASVAPIPIVKYLLEFGCWMFMKMSKVNAEKIGQNYWFGDQTHDTVILYAHGGGFVMGNAKQILVYKSFLHLLDNCSILSVEYSLNNPDTALEDFMNAYRWLRNHTSVPNIIFGGDSAGAHIVLKATSRVVEKPRAVFCFSPWVNLLDFTGTTNTVDFVCEANLTTVKSRITMESNQQSLLLEDWTNIPPCMIVYGEYEFFSRQIKELIQHMKRNACDVRVFRGTGCGNVHVYPLFYRDKIVSKMLEDWVLQHSH